MDFGLYFMSFSLDPSCEIKYLRMFKMIPLDLLFRNPRNETNKLFSTKNQCVDIIEIFIDL